MSRCKYKDVFKPICNERTTQDNNMCKAHQDLKCVSCGYKAVKSCPYIKNTVCCMPLCDDCTHYTIETVNLSLKWLKHTHKRK